MIIPVILSGGAGTRLWPVSREGHPKPFMRMADGQSLLLKTYLRASKLASAGEILTVTNRDYYFLSKDEFSASGISSPVRSSYLLEPSGRNTAPAVALAALRIAGTHGRDATMLVLAADHLILDEDAFGNAVEVAAALAGNGQLVTFGIVPTAPETGFGYIECGAAMGGGRAVSRFVEKPSLEKAREFVASDKFLWNSGMFCFKAGSILDALEQHAPDVFQAAMACWAEMTAEPSVPGTMQEIPELQFNEVPNISVDYAVMERAQNVMVVPGTFGWSDIGSWDAVSQLAKPDKDNNRSVGEVMFVSSRNTFVQSEDRLVAAVGTDNLLIIDTPDALLVANSANAQDVKQVVAKLKSQGHEAYKLHRTVSRPWGTYTILGEGSRYKIKRIEVKPGGRLSLQMHHHRSEHWIVVHGMARVVNGDQEIFVSTNESTYIPAGHRHRLENPGVLPLVMIEVQSGEYLGEDDIVRFEDIYGRA
jgi:mannose-1-phosphate guanylyltransferase